MPLDPAETSAGDEHLPSPRPTDAWVPDVSLSVSPPGSLLLQIQCCFCKIHIWSFRDPNVVIPIFLGSSRSLVFSKNMKHAMFLQK